MVSITPEFSFWSYNAALFVRWALGKPALWEFVSRSFREGASEELFRQCFGFGYFMAEERIRENFKALTQELSFPVRLNRPVPRPEFRAARDLEIRRIISELERLESDYLRPRYPQIANDYLRAALTTLAKNKGDSRTDPEFMATWGLCALQAGDTAKARECLEAMGTGSGVVRPKAYLALARLRYDDSVSRAPDHQLNPNERDAVLEPLLKAISLPPALPEEYRLLLDLCEHSADTGDPRIRRTLEMVPRLFPKDAELAQRLKSGLAHD